MKLDVATTMHVRRVLDEIIGEKLDRSGLRPELSQRDASEMAAVFTATETAARKLDIDGKKRLQAEAARRRLDAGTFGVCLECHEDIALNRIKASPWEPNCIGCQEKINRIEKGEAPGLDALFA